MSPVTFKRIASDESRIYDSDGDYVGDVYAQDDILNPGSRVLFAAITGRTASSDFFKPCVIGFGILHPLCGPATTSRAV